MTSGHVAVVLSVLILAIFGATMVGLDLLARTVLPAVRPLVEQHAPTVYTCILGLAVVLLVVTGRLDVGAVLEVQDPLGFTVALALVPLVALGWYLTELSVASHEVRVGGMIEPSAARDAVEALGRRAGLWWALALASAVLEEFVFRGMLLSALSADYGVLAAVAVSALVFGLHHVAFGVPSIVSKTVGGVGMGAQTVLGGSILAAMATHICFQALVYRRLRRMEARRVAA